MADLHGKWMTQALELAARGAGWVSPNPMVGAVVVRDGIEVGQGWHQRFGGPHAEVFALRDAGKNARGSTLYCTLEPCNHTGKTPPCVQAVIAAGISTVVLGACDPNPVASGGIAALRAAGVNVIEGVLEPECRRVNAAFFKSVKTDLPLVALKWAMSLDGKIATQHGDSKWITGERARLFARRLRGQYDAVVAGIGTVLADDPALNVRLESDAETAAIRQPRRVILDTHARTPIGSKLFGVQRGGALTIVMSCAADAEAKRRGKKLREMGADVVEVDAAKNGSVDVVAAIRALKNVGVLSVLVEGGAKVLGACVDARLADRAHVFIAPKVIGGVKSLTAVGGVGVDAVANALEFIDGSTRTKNLDRDVMIEGALSEWGWML